MAEQDKKLEQELQVTRFVDGQLSPREAEELQRQMKGDPALGEALHGYDALSRNLRAAAQAGIPGADYDQQRGSIMAALERRALVASQKRRVVFFLRPAFIGAVSAAAAVLVLATMAVLHFRPQTPTNNIAGNPPVTANTELAVGVVLPASPEPTGTPEVEVEYPQVKTGDLPLAPDELAAADTAAPDQGTPDGTVIVSVGDEGNDNAPSSDLGFPMPYALD